MGKALGLKRVGVETHKEMRDISSKQRQTFQKWERGLVIRISEYKEILALNQDLPDSESLESEPRVFSLEWHYKMQVRKNCGSFSLGPWKDLS